jgi:hypothetical protein
MNNKINIIIITVLLVNLLGMVVGFSYLQQEINQLHPQTLNPTPTPNPTSILSPNPTNNSSGEETSNNLPYAFVAYEWNLKPEYINNITWLNQSMGMVGKPDYYNVDETWKENYFDYLSRHIAYPQQAKDDPLVWGLLGRSVFVNAEFDEATGHTKATYQYAEYQNETMLYGIENFLPKMVDANGWTKNFT